MFPYTATTDIIVLSQLPLIDEVIRTQNMSLLRHVACMESSSRCPGLPSPTSLRDVSLSGGRGRPDAPSHRGTRMPQIGNDIQDSKESWEFLISIREWEILGCLDLWLSGPRIFNLRPISMMLVLLVRCLESKLFCFCRGNLLGSNLTGAENRVKTR